MTRPCWTPIEESGAEQYCKFTILLNTTGYKEQPMYVDMRLILIIVGLGLIGGFAIWLDFYNIRCRLEKIDQEIDLLRKS